MGQAVRIKPPNPGALADALSHCLLRLLRLLRLLWLLRLLRLFRLFRLFRRLLLLRLRLRLLRLLLLLLLLRLRRGRVFRLCVRPRGARLVRERHLTHTPPNEVGIGGSRRDSARGPRGPRGPRGSLGSELSSPSSSSSLPGSPSSSSSSISSSSVGASDSLMNLAMFFWLFVFGPFCFLPFAFCLLYSFAVAVHIFFSGPPFRSFLLSVKKNRTPWEEKKKKNRALKKRIPLQITENGPTRRGFW